MAEYNGPYELPDNGGIPMFLDGRTCPILKAITTEGMVKGPAYVIWDRTSTQYSWGCTEPTTINYVFHSALTTKITGTSSTYTYPSGYPYEYRDTTDITVRVVPYYSVVYTPQPRDTYGNNINGWLNARTISNIQELIDYKGDTYWLYDYAEYTTQYLFVANYSPGCPLGTTFDPEWGTCVPDDGYVWDEETETYQLAQCITVDGPESVCSKGKYEYTVKQIDKYTLEPITMTEDTMIYLSYPSGSIKNHLHFTAPTSVIMEAGTSEVSFDLVLYNNSNNGYFNIMPTSDLIGSCDGALNVILECEEEDTPDSSLPGYCCTYVPKDFIDWKSCEEFHEPYGHIVSTASDQIDNDGEPCGTSCSFFTNKFETWMSCTKFDEPEYPGNMLKDGTILE